MTSILIIGGGIGGLATAAALHTFGIQADVYERASTLAEVGAAISLWPNATRVLRHLGILDDLMKHSHAAPVAALRNRRGHILRQMTHFQTDTPALFTHRATLHASLLAAVPSSQIHLDKTFTRFETDGEKVRAHFADGSMSPWYDGLIGADGIHSVVRQQLLHDGEPRYQGYVAWRGVTHFPSDDAVGETWGPGSRFGFIPLGDNRVGWWATANIRSPEATLRQTPVQWKAEGVHLFAHWHPPIPGVIEATPPESIVCNMISDRPPAPRWSEGPVTLLGDAAHPTTPNLGQGGCMAIEDAALLARSIHAVPSLAQAFRVYEATRRPRTAMIVRQSRSLGKIAQWQNPLAWRARDFLTRLASDRRFHKMFQELWAYDAWTTPFVMPL